MQTEKWNSFPRKIENKINALLDEAEPTPNKAFQLYKVCQRENLWEDSYDAFSRKLFLYYQTPRPHRRKSDFDAILERPMSMDVYQEFQLNFRNGRVNSRDVMEIANWASHTLRFHFQVESLVANNDVLHRTIKYLTCPPSHEKAQDITFEDFCAAWRQTVNRLFGRKYEKELESALLQIERLPELPTEKDLRDEISTGEEPTVPSVYLTQTEIDWTLAVQAAVENNAEAPKFPLSRGPEKMRLIELSKTISLYRIVRTTTNEEFLKHREKIRATILDQCRRLHRDRAK